MQTLTASIPSCTDEKVIKAWGIKDAGYVSYDCGEVVLPNPVEFAKKNVIISQLRTKQEKESPLIFIESPEVIERYKKWNERIKNLIQGFENGDNKKICFKSRDDIDKNGVNSKGLSYKSFHLEIDKLINTLSTFQKTNPIQNEIAKEVSTFLKNSLRLAGYVDAHSFTPRNDFLKKFLLNDLLVVELFGSEYRMLADKQEGKIVVRYAEYGADQTEKEQVGKQKSAWRSYYNEKQGFFRFEELSKEKKWIEVDDPKRKEHLNKFSNYLYIKALGVAKEKQPLTLPPVPRTKTAD
jgi:hypothetical protein